MRIDAHQHFWNYNPQRDTWITDEMQVLRQSFLPNDLEPLLQFNQLDGCVAVQADQSEEETNFLLTLAAVSPVIKGVVGWIDLRADNLEDRLIHYKAYNDLKGFRHIVQGESPGFLADRKFIKGVQLLGDYGYTYDLLVYHHQLTEALVFVNEVPGVSIVIDHLAKPSIRTGEKTKWELNMAALSTFSNVYCKVSGMVTEADWKHWTAEDFFPYLDELMETFGAQRLLYGSDWPVCLLAASYQEQYAALQRYIVQLSANEQKAIMGDNAVKFYNL